MGTNNVINNLIYSPAGAVGLSGAKFIDNFQSALAATTTDLYTVPSGKRAIIYPNYGANGSATPVSITSQAKIKSGGNYYAISASTSTSMSGLVLNPSAPIILEAGESASVTISGGTALNFGYPILEFDNTISVKTAKALSVISGNTTLYTCPANTKAFILDQNCGVGTATGLGQLYYSNNSGSAVTRRWNIVNSGGSVSPSSAASASTSIPNTNIDIAGTCSIGLNAGDFISFTSGSATATQMIWVNIMEVPG